MLALHHVTVPMSVGGQAAAEEFYSGLLGLPRVKRPEPMGQLGHWYYLPTGQHLHVLPEDPCVPGDGPHFALLVEDIDAMAAKLKSVQWDESWPELRRLFCHDPFGNRIELIHAPDLANWSPEPL